MRETPAKVALPLLARLKLTLLRRHFERNQLGGWGLLIFVLIFTAALTLGALLVLYYCRQYGEPARDRAMLWTAWILTLLWLNAPLSQFDTQRSLDLSALRLLPLSAGTFTRAVLLDALLAPQGVILLIPLGVLLAAFTLHAAELPLVMLSLGLLLLANLAYGQALYLTFSRLLSSRRFADISMVFGMLLIFLFQGLNLWFNTARRAAELPGWAGPLLDTLTAIFGPLLAWLYPSLAAGVVAEASAGQGPLALAKATALLAQVALGLWLAGRATRAFYEGELESGGKGGGAGIPARNRWQASMPAPPGIVGALFFRERAYLWRDPLLKGLFLQSLFSVAYFSMLAVFIGFRDSRPLVEPRYLLLGAAFMLTYGESYLLFNKFGLEGQQLTSTLLSPVSRSALLRGKSAFFLSHFLALNLLIVAGLGIALSVPALYIAAALAVLTVNACLVDVAGHFISVWFPFAYRRQGRHIRAHFAQTGCGFMFIYGLVTQACNIAVIPLSLAIGGGAHFYGWPGLAFGSALGAAAVAAAFMYGLPLAARQLEQREPLILDAVARNVE